MQHAHCRAHNENLFKKTGKWNETLLIGYSTITLIVAKTIKEEKKKRWALFMWKMLNSFRFVFLFLTHSQHATLQVSWHLPADALLDIPAAHLLVLQKNCTQHKNTLRQDMWRLWKCNIEFAMTTMMTAFIAILLTQISRKYKRTS